MNDGRRGNEAPVRRPRLCLFALFALVAALAGTACSSTTAKEVAKADAGGPVDSGLRDSAGDLGEPPPVVDAGVDTGSASSAAPGVDAAAACAVTHTCGMTCASGQNCGGGGTVTCVPGGEPCAAGFCRAYTCALAGGKLNTTVYACSTPTVTDGTCTLATTVDAGDP